MSSENCNCKELFGCSVTIPVGPKGDKGDKGDTGATGPMGPKGDKGDVGPAGADGLDGAQGPQGVPGPTGPQGDTGPAGPAGPTGATGADGADGAEIFFGSGVPGVGLGDDGDVYYDTTTTAPQTDIYQKVGGVWNLIGTFGNVVNVSPGVGAEDAYLFKAIKTIPQNLDASTVDTIINVEDDSTSPTYFDNANVWSGFNWKTPEVTSAATKFTVEDFEITNNNATPVTVTVNIVHYPAAGGGPFVIGTGTIAGVAGTGGTGTLAMLASTPQSFAIDDEVKLEAVVDTLAIPAGDVVVSANVIFYVQD